MNKEWLAQRFELSRGGSVANLRPMEGLRGFAVFLVFLVHFVTLIQPWMAGHPGLLAFATALHTVGNSGVDLFFVLSGYLIYGSLISRPQHFLPFMTRRVARIYPAFVAVFAIYLALSWLLPAESKIPAGTAASLVYLVENFLLLPGLFPVEPMITVAWSLSYEMFYYLTVPLLIAALRLRERSSIWRSAFLVGAALAFAGYCALTGGPVRLIMFVSGILLYETMQAPRAPSPHGWLGLSALCAGLLCMLIPAQGSGALALKVGGLFVAYFVLCLSCFRTPTAWLARLFCWTPLRWLGNMSYSYYLLHGLALKAAFVALARVLPVADYGAWVFWVLLPLMFAVTLIPTSMLFLLVERRYSLSPGKAKA